MATRTPPPTIRSALRTPSKQGLTVHKPGVKANLLAMAHTSSLFYARTFPTLPTVWSAYGRPHRDTLTVLRSLSKSTARKRNFVSAEVVFQKLHSSITLEISKRSARQIRACCPLGTLPDSLGLCLGPSLCPPMVFWSLVCWCPSFPSTVSVFEACGCVVCSRFARPVSCVADLSSFGCWRYSLPCWRLWKTWSQTVFNPFWKRPLGSLRQSQPWSAPCLPHFCGLGPARALLCPGPLPIVLVASFCSASVGHWAVRQELSRGPA